MITKKRKGGKKGKWPTLEVPVQGIEKDGKGQQSHMLMEKRRRGKDERVCHDERKNQRCKEGRATRLIYFVQEWGKEEMLATPL